MTHQSLADYLAALPEERRQSHRTLVGMIAERLGSAPRIHELVFLPGQPHPVYDDSEAVFWHGVRQLMLAQPDTDAAAGELPLVWFGYDIMSRLSRKREAQGFLLTDRRLLVKDQVDGIFGKAMARQYPLFVGPAGASTRRARAAGDPGRRRASRPGSGAGTAGCREI